ncbi:hypothetical protein JZ751_010737 [Albula glossodonta]|uniref:Alpha-type protein kinase domain-containing protein n=1 Tax=Albula glossodonta TaxID=121402 RepID=A0A8T2NAY2_9TELE|nr:hypothetical protein JZ751_010737 [Albula glossodonta]
MAEEELMFSMEGVGSAHRGTGQKMGSYTEGNSDDEDDYLPICPITDDPASPTKEICDYLKNLIHSKQLAAASPKSSLQYKSTKETEEELRSVSFGALTERGRFHLEDIETELCIRYRKKLSNFSHSSNWKSASNYVAKRYMEPVARDVYLEDVRLQMEAKLWGEEYNRHRPPKQVDIMQMCVIEMTGRPGKPVFHLEHYIEGKYIKYNSNSGFVRDENIRLTPQAFSHFTFERSGHQLIVVDIQGKSAKTVLRGCEEPCGSPRVRTLSSSRLPPLLSRLSETSSYDDNMSDPDSIPCSPMQLSSSDLESGGDSGYPSERRSEGDPEPGERACFHGSRHLSETDEDSAGRKTMAVTPKTPMSANGTPNQPLTEERWSFFHTSRQHFHRPSCVAVEVERLNALVLERKICKSILGKVHLAMVRYHEAGRFSEKDEEWDRDAAMYHLERAAMCGELEAIVALGQCYLQLPHHVLPEVTVEDTENNRKRGFQYLLQAATAGDRPSMILVARAFDTGLNLSSDRTQDWQEAVHWYNCALNMTDYDEGGEFDGMQDEPRYLLLAREAEMYQEGQFGLGTDFQRAGDLFTEAADAAMEAMKGRLANQYYMKAEDAWSMMED